MTVRLRILSANVRGVGSSGKLNLIIQELNHLNCDIVLLQETHVSCKKQADHFETLWKGQCYWSFGIGKSAGVAVLFSPNFSGKIIRFQTDSDGRVLSLLVQFNNFKFNLVNVYSPNSVSDRKTFFSCLHDFFILQGDLIIGGDFNCIDNVLDKLNCSAVISTDKKSLSSLMCDFSLVDIWRKQNPRKTLFTWSNNDHTQASRIDRFLIAKSLVSKITSSEILPCVLSDHDFVKLEILIGDFSNHRARVWRFNNSLLSDPDFKILLSSAIVDFKVKIPNFKTLPEWWDHLKIEIRNVCVKFCSRHRKSAFRDRISLTKQLIRAKKMLHSRQSGDASVVSNLECQFLRKLRARK